MHRLRLSDGRHLAAGLRIGVPGGSGAKVAPLAFETCALAKSKTL